MRYRVEMFEGLAHLFRDDGTHIGRALTLADAERIREELNAPSELRDRILDAVTDAIEEAFE